jgi:superfamily II DNA/RNA helicase
VAEAAAPTSNESGFALLGVTPAVVKVLATAGITEPSPIQLLTIPDALAGRDVCGKARTGSGKTLAFGIPMLARCGKGRPGHPAALVLVPTRELAVQVARSIAPVAAIRNQRIHAVYGGVPLGGQIRALHMGVDIVIATPGRLNDLLERGALSVSEVKVAVLDEADQMADLGFMPQVQRILDRVGPERQVLLFSATLDGEVDKLVRRYQQDPLFHEAATPEDEQVTMLHRFIAVEPAEKVAVSAAIAAGPERIIMFVRTQRAADRLVMQLDHEGVAAGRIHGRMSQPQRQRALGDFASGRVPVLVATNIAARGIHVDNVDIVVHHDPPEDAKTYVHRSGRTARAGANGIVVTLVEPGQEREVAFLRRDAGIREAVVPMGPADPRLADLGGWEPPQETPQVAPLRGPQQRRPGPGPRGPRFEGRGGPRRSSFTPRRDERFNRSGS